MTRMPTNEVAEHAERISQMYDEYNAARRDVRKRLMAELETRVEEETKHQLVELSRKVRAAYDIGVPKGVLRKATRAYTNPDSWNRVWETAAAEVVVEDRGQKSVATVKTPFEVITDDPKDQGARFIDAGKKATLVIRSGPDGLPWDEPVEIRLERKALRGPWVMDPEVETWFFADGENLVLDHRYEALRAWGSGDDESAIQRIEQEYAPRKVK